MASLKQDLIRLRKLRTQAEDLGRRARAAGAKLGAFEQRTLERMRHEDIDALRTGGVLYTTVDKVKGQVTDRKAYVRWALEQDGSVAEFLGELVGVAMAAELDPEPLIEKFYATVQNLELVQLKESQATLNEQASRHLEDGVPLPPGMDFRPAPYISQRTA